MVTKRKKKPTCVKGQACGYACIPLLKKNGEPRGCGQPVPEEVAEVNLSAVPAKGKKTTQRKAKVKPSVRAENDNTVQSMWETAKNNSGEPAIKAVHSVDPGKLNITKKDFQPDSPGRALHSDDDEGVQKIKKLAESKGVSEEAALAMGIATKNWLGGGYASMSPLTYRPTKDIENETIHFNQGNLAILAATTAALKTVPGVDPNNDDIKGDPGYKDWDKKTVKRWIRVDNLEEIQSKYKEGSTITEDGMFGTSILSADKMSGFSESANIEYNVSPKLDGSGNGKYVEGFKGQSNEGEVLFVPGTKFKVTRIDKPRPPYFESFSDVKDLENAENYLSEHKDSLQVDGRDTKNIYSIATGSDEEDENGFPVSRLGSLKEAQEAIKAGLPVWVDIKKKPLTVNMEEE